MRPTLPALALVLFCLEAPAQSLVISRAPIVQLHAEQSVLEEMARIIAPCVQPTSTSRVFTRCYDTHSSIHAHWAVYRIARNGAAPHLPFVSQAALTPAKLRFETTYMRYPYAAAWFLRLVVDYEKWALTVGADDPFRLRPVGDQMAAWLKSYYDVRPIRPYTGEYNNPAWALYQLHSYYGHTRNGKLADEIRAKINKAFVVKINGLTFASDRNARAFFSVFGNWLYVVARTQPRSELRRFLALQSPILTSHLAVNNLSSVHSYGLSWSRMWALRALADTATTPGERQRFQKAADLHLAEGIKRHARLKGNFFAYDHWVPQFAVYAITEKTERDG